MLTNEQEEMLEAELPRDMGRMIALIRELSAKCERMESGRYERGDVWNEMNSLRSKLAEATQDPPLYWATEVTRLRAELKAEKERNAQYIERCREYGEQHERMDALMYDAQVIIDEARSPICYADEWNANRARWYAAVSKASPDGERKPNE